MVDKDALETIKYLTQCNTGLANEMYNMKERMDAFEQDAAEKRKELLSATAQHHGEIGALKAKVQGMDAVRMQIGLCNQRIAKMKIQMKTIIAMSGNRRQINCNCGVQFDVPQLVIEKKIPDRVPSEVPPTSVSPPVQESYERFFPHSPPRPGQTKTVACQTIQRLQNITTQTNGEFTVEMSSAPTSKMMAMVGRPDPYYPRYGPVTLIDPDGSWEFQPAQHHSERDHLYWWKRLVTDGGGYVLDSSSFILPVSMGGILMNSRLYGADPKKVEMMLFVPDVEYNQDAVLPFKGILELRINDRDSLGVFLIDKKNKYITALSLDSTGLSSRHLPKVHLRFRPLLP